MFKSSPFVFLVGLNTATVIVEEYLEAISDHFVSFYKRGKASVLEGVQHSYCKALDQSVVPEAMTFMLESLSKQLR